MGGARITSLGDNTVEAKLCNLLFNDTLDEVISSGQWTAATFRATLAKTGNTPAFQYSNEFQLPVLPFSLKVISINNVDLGNVDFSIEGDKLLTNESSIKIKYIGRLTDPQNYGVYITRVMVTRLTAELSYQLGGQAAVTAKLYRKYEDDLDDALSLDGQQGSPDQTTTDDIIEVR